MTSSLRGYEPLWSEVTRLWAPPPSIKLSDWADKNFRLSEESSSEPGRWRTRAYQREILDSFTDPLIEIVTVKKSSRIGYTKMLNIDTSYHIEWDPCTQLIVQPTIQDAEDYSKDDIDTMIRDNGRLAELVSDEKTGRKSTMKKKRYPGGSLTLVGANSGAGFRRIFARRVKFDEVNGYPISAGKEGDPISLGKRRSDDAWNRKIILGSTPTEEGASRITKSYGQSDQRSYHVPCPACGHLQVLEWKNFRFGMDGIGSLTWPVFLCVNERCRNEIGFDRQRDMVENGRWIAAAPFRGHAGFRIWAAYSYSPNATWAKIAQEFRDANPSPELLQVFFNTVVGEDWGNAVEEFEWTPLHKRRENYGAEVPAAVRCLTAWVDVQHDRFEWEVVGWGAEEESWAIAFERLHLDPTQASSWPVLREKLASRYKRADGTLLDIALVGVDSGYLADDVYAFCRTNGAQFFIPTKGSNEIGQPIANFPRNRTKENVYLTHLGTDTAKNVIYKRYELAAPGPGYLHHPDRAEFDETYFAQATAERRITFYRAGVPFHRWIADGKRNEVLDIKVGNLALIRILQQHRGVDLSISQELLGVGVQSEAAPEPEKKPPPASESRGDWLRGVDDDWVR